MIILRQPVRRASRVEKRFRPVDDRAYCVVAACGVRSRRLDADGVCPPELWDTKHDDYARALRMSERQSA